MKKIYLLCLTLLTLNATYAQTWGNEWIDYGQQYYKFPIVRTGIYRIDYNALVTAGIDVQTLDPRNIQVFGRNKQVPIYIEGDSDGAINPNDYIEFYAMRNDGWMDSLLYQPGQTHGNPYFSFYNDTAYYYLSWNQTGNNLRMENVAWVPNSGLPNATHFIREWVDVRDNPAVLPSTRRYAEGIQNAAKSYDPEFTTEETFGGGRINAANANVTNAVAVPVIPTANGVTVNGQNNQPILAQYEFRAVSVSNDVGGAPNHRYTVKFGSSATLDTAFTGFQLVTMKRSVPVSTMGATTTPQWGYFRPPGVTAASSRVVYHKLTYPHNFNLENQTAYRMLVPDNANGTGLVMANANNLNRPNNGTPRLYDITNGKRIQVNLAGSNLNAILPNGNTGLTEFFITSDGAITTLNNLQPVNTDPLNFARFVDYENTVKDHDYVIITHSSLTDGANAYKTFRAGQYNPVVVDIDQLYHQFGGGVVKHPLSIRHFMGFALQNWNVKPEYLFLLGKSVLVNGWRPFPADAIEGYAENLVPSFGFPQSDVALVSRINGSGIAPAVKVGRLAAINNNEIQLYLDKVITNETTPAELWRKNVLHFGGGTNLTEQAQFVNYLAVYDSILTDTAFGGNVTTIIGSTSDPLDISLADSIQNTINAGVSLMNFFGHAAGGTTSVSAGPPETWQNAGKYPIVLANSCLIGDIHQPRTFYSSSEDHLFQPQKGAIAFLASVGPGVPAFLNSYTSQLMKNFSYLSYGKSIGESIKKTVEFLRDNGAEGSDLAKCTVLEMTLHGDPAIKISPNEKPDYMVDASSIFYTPNDVTNDVDSFDVNIAITNLGRAVSNIFAVRLTRKFPDGSDTTYTKGAQNVYYRDTVVFRLPLNFLKGIGLNEFTVVVDNNSEVDEFNETNNQVTSLLNITANDITPVYPYNFAIVPAKQLQLKGSTANPFAPARPYRFQVDTTDSFINPIINQVVVAPGGVVSLNVDLANFPDSVFFWRVSPDSTNPSENFKWKQFSFKHKAGKFGWAQDHFFQYKRNNYNLLINNNTTRLFEFFTGAKTLLARNQNYCPTCFGVFNDIYYNIDQNQQEYDGYNLDPKYHIAVIDSTTLEPWIAYGGDCNGNFWSLNRNYNHLNRPENSTQCGNSQISYRRRPEKYFIFRSQHPNFAPVDMPNMINMLNQIPNGAYVLVYSWGGTRFQQNIGNHRQAFTNVLGLDSLDQIPDGSAYIGFVRKGDPTYKYAIHTTTEDGIILTADLPTNKSFGQMSSELIGPAQNWNTLEWMPRAMNNESNQDTLRLKLIGVKPNGEEVVVIDNILPTTPSVDISNIDASVYPYMRLNMFVKDDTIKTPMQLDYWQILYNPYPEYVVAPNKYLSIDNDTMQEGETFKIGVAAENVTPFALQSVDSLNVKWWMFNNNNQQTNFPYNVIPNIPPNGWDTLTFTQPTIGLQGLNNLWVELNPFGQGHKLEQYHYNNYANFFFRVGGDRINPLLDVTFDGVHIMDGDIVSPKPQIIITLKDENQYLQLDTNTLKVFITEPDGVAPVQIPYINNQSEIILDFTPPNMPNNKAKINWAPLFTKDGKYELLVKGIDKSGNNSGANDYRIKFEVINKSTITNVLNYPNPFSTKTKFVFTLTGSQIPDMFKIQIMIITGKVVKEINQDELGPLRIGRNITEYAWDGTDEFGDPLANGIYLYRVVTKINGSEIEQRETNADQFFNKGFGKMYLMR